MISIESGILLKNHAVVILCKNITSQFHFFFPHICGNSRNSLSNGGIDQRNFNNRNKLPEVFYDEAVLKNFTKFTGTHLFNKVL